MSLGDSGAVPNTDILSRLLQAKVKVCVLSRDLLELVLLLMVACDTQCQGSSDGSHTMSAGSRCGIPTRLSRMLTWAQFLVA